MSVRAVASVENVPNSGAFREHMIYYHNKFEFYIPVNFVILELVGGIKKNTWRGMITTIMPKHKVLYLYV